MGLCPRHHQRPRLWGGTAPLTVLDFDDFILWVTFGIIVGGRLGNVLFYDPSYYAANPLEIVMLWHGGMAFHGGFLGCVIAVILFARHRRIPILSLGDLTCAVVPIGLFLGRIANFINDELWGRPSDVPWAMVFPRAPDALPRHPSQLYEAGLEGLVLFTVLALLVRAGALQTARADHRRVHGRLRHRPHGRRILPRAGSAARTAGARADHGHGAVLADDPHRPRADCAMRCGGRRSRPDHG